VPRIFDNIEVQLLPALDQTLELSHRADFCVGYFNLRGWKELEVRIESWPGGEGHQCRLLVGMQRLPQEELRESLAIVRRDGKLDNQTANRLKKRLAEDFRKQLAFGVPTDQDEAGLRRLTATAFRSAMKAELIRPKIAQSLPPHSGCRKGLDTARRRAQTCTKAKWI